MGSITRMRIKDLKYFRIYRFHSFRSKRFAFRMMLNVFLEIDMFDFKRKVETRNIRKINLGSNDYMWYSPVYTSVAREMIAIAKDFYNSALKYNEENDKTVFIDLGGGLGKPSLLAREANAFSRIISVDIDEKLVNKAKSNFESRRKYQTIESLLVNVEDKKNMRALFGLLSTAIGRNYTLFVFNKNSYGPQVLKHSLRFIDEFGPRKIIYLYQNPVHVSTLTSFKYEEFARDAQPSSAHKNFKYRLYWKATN